MSVSLETLPFIDLYLRLDGQEPPVFRSNERGKGIHNQLVPEEFLPTVEQFSTAIRAELQDRTDGTLTLDGLRVRLSKQQMADGSLWACARRINTDLPNLFNLGFATHISTHMHSLGEREGLIIVSGSAGHGKTTTAAALLIDFMQTHGGTAITIEDPVEYVLKGRHGAFGQCFQIEPEGNNDWAPTLERALRWGPRYIFVGEVRTPQAAEQLIHAATTGHTVITTLHGGMPEEALTSLLFLAEQAMGAGAGNILAGCLTALLHQTMKEDGPFVKYLFTEENAPGDPIRSLIRENKIGMLSTYIDRISARLANQQAPIPAYGQTGSGGSHGGSVGGMPPLPPLPPIRK
ncbi:MAG: ATPase, T2SS/T4P/T4SS family [Alphaproteobacteria bacterium]|nr:ATPase, T2SS/T4P/T4SS family [Alphaproteobacteria bacterium]